MLRRISILVICLLIGISTIGYVQNKKNVDFFSILFTPKQQTEYGLHKLTQRERKSLSNYLMQFFSSITKSKKIGDSAVEFLKNDGWEEVKVIGKQKLKLNKHSNAQEYLIVENWPWTYILESRTYYYKLEPGKYLGKMGYTSSEIIDSDGDIVKFWTEDKK